MLFLLVIIFVLLGAALFTNLILSEPGYVLLGYGEMSVELPLIDFLIVLTLILVVLFLLMKLLMSIFKAPRKFRGMRNRQQGNKARKGLTRGLIDMAAGEWNHAEKIVLKGVERADAPLLNYLVAAHAAQQLDETERRDEHIRKAIEADPQAEVAVGLTQAELQIRQKQYEEALATLQRLEQLAPKHKFVKKQLARLFFKLKDWQQLSEMLPTLRKQGGIKPDELRMMELATFNARMEEAAEKKDLEGLQRLWGEVPKNLKTRPQVIAVYAEMLLRTNKNSEVEKVLKEGLDRELDDDLIKLYSRIEFSEPAKALAHAEKWLSKSGKGNAKLLTMLGHLSLKARLWGRAGSLLQQSIAIDPSAESYQAMAELHELTDEPLQALEAYKESLKLTV